jgi:Flp pilus assembly protein TadD
LVEIGDGEGALIAAQRSLDVFVTAHDHYRETYSLLELGKAQIIAGQGEEGLNTLDRVLEIATDNESKDFEFILEIEGRMADVLQTLGRVDEADEIRRRIKAVEEVVKEE